MKNIKGKYNTAVIKTDNVEEEALQQIQNLCDRPEYEGANIVIMPDVHAGKGCTVGTTMHVKNHKIDPRLVGVDISCGILTVSFKLDEKIDYERLENIIRENIPSGQNIRLSTSKHVTKEIVRDVQELATKIKHFGMVPYYLNSLGTLGGGNHYIELGESNGRYYLSIHTGSRKLGSDVCNYFTPSLADRGENLKKEKFKLAQEYLAQGKDKEIQDALDRLEKSYEYIPPEYIEGEKFEEYLHAMNICERYANLNRKIIALDILEALDVKEYDSFTTMHNYIEILPHNEIMVRKGAIDASYGKKVAIPLNMRDGVIIGIGKGNPDWNNSAPHGAGRLMSRTQARKELKMEEFKDAMKGINTWSVANTTIDEAPMAYKPAEEIIELIKDTVDIQFIVKPLYNFKATEENRIRK